MDRTDGQMGRRQTEKERARGIGEWDRRRKRAKRTKEGREGHKE